MTYRGFSESLHRRTDRSGCGLPGTQDCLVSFLADGCKAKVISSGAMLISTAPASMRFGADLAERIRQILADPGQLYLWRIGFERCWERTG